MLVEQMQTAHNEIWSLPDRGWRYRKDLYREEGGNPSAAGNDALEPIIVRDVSDCGKSDRFSALF